jgi:hypothetical protein
MENYELVLNVNQYSLATKHCWVGFSIPYKVLFCYHYVWHEG